MPLNFLLLVLLLQDYLMFSGVDFGLLEHKEVQEATKTGLFCDLLSLVEVEVIVTDVSDLL